MASAGPNPPGTGTGTNQDVATGTTFAGQSWTNAGNIASLNASYAATSAFNSGDLSDRGASLIVAGSRAGSNLWTGTALAANTSVQQYTYGGPTALWGLAPTVAQVNASDFGFAWGAQWGSAAVTTKWIHATNFGFAVPAGATIDGVEVSVYWRQTATSGSRAPNLDYVSVTVYYTEAATGGHVPARRSSTRTLRRM